VIDWREKTVSGRKIVVAEQALAKFVVSTPFKAAIVITRRRRFSGKTEQVETGKFKCGDKKITSLDVDVERRPSIYLKYKNL
jgi:hypothetical protein